MHLVHPSLLAALVALALSPAAAGAKPRLHTGMYDDRYCEVLAIHGEPERLVADVWGTYALNSCPAARWAAQDPDALAEQLGALAVRLNGPRHWLIDSATITVAPGLGQVRSLGGLRMRRIAQLPVPMHNGAPGLAPYTEATVLRETTLRWSPRHPLHELVAPDGTRYAMQSYARIADPALSRGDLAGLGRRLDLPEGWRYRTRRLRRPLVLTSHGQATILQDDLLNTYQRQG